MRWSSLLYSLCLVLVASCFSSRVAAAAKFFEDDEGSLFSKIPGDLKKVILGYADIELYLAVVGSLEKEARKGLRQSPETELAMLKNKYDFKSGASLMKLWVSDILEAGAKETGDEGTEVRGVEVTRGKLLGELFKALDSKDGWAYFTQCFACVRALVADERLSAAVWKELVDFAVEKVATGTAPKEVIVFFLFNFLATAAAVGASEAISVIVYETEQAGININLADRDNVLIVTAIANGHVEVARFLLRMKEEKPELYGGIDPAAYDNEGPRAAFNRWHVGMLEFLWEKKKTRPELYEAMTLEWNLA